MRLKIWRDRECEKFCKILWELNKALVTLGKNRVYLFGAPSPSLPTTVLFV
jgi:hypothetical protein